MTQLEIILLALLFEKDCYGYEIEALIEQRHIRELSEIGFSSIYNALNKLETRKLIDSRFEKEYGSPKRKVYFLKEDTRSLVLQELKRMLSEPRPYSSEFDLALTFSHLLNMHQRREAITHHKETLKYQRAQILKGYNQQPHSHNNISLKVLFSRPLKLLNAEIEWLEDFEKDLI